MNTHLPQFGGGTRMQRHQGHPQPKPHAPVRRQQRPAGDPEKVRMQRQIDVMARKLARSEAKEIVDRLEQEGILFENRDQHVELFSLLDAGTIAFEVERIKKNYRRRDPDPTQLGATYPGAARYARADAADAAAGGDAAPSTPQEAVAVADIMRSQKMSMPDAIKFMRSRGQNGQPRR
jgi:hypothetical protein